MKSFSKRTIYTLSLLSFYFSMFTFSFAEENIISLEEIVVTAAKLEEEIEETTGTIVVIKSEDIEKRAQSYYELFKKYRIKG